MHGEYLLRSCPIQLQIGHDGKSFKTKIHDIVKCCGIDVSERSYHPSGFSLLKFKYP